MADQRYLVWKTEPNTHYASLPLALAKAEEAALADEGATYLVREAVVYDVSNVSTADVTTIVSDRWDQFDAGYNFDEATGALRLDEGSGGRDLVDTNNVVSVVGKVRGNAIRMDNNLDRLSYSGTEFRVTGDITVIFWVRPRQAWFNGNNDLITVRDGVGNTDYRIRTVAGSTLECNVRDSVSGSESATFVGATTVDRWYFCSMVYDSSTKRVRAGVDGASFVTSAALGVSIRQVSNELRLECSSSINDWEMEGLYFFTEAKSDTWVIDQWREGVGRVHPENL